MAQRRSPERDRRMVGGYMEKAVADRFYDTCRALGTNQSEVVRGLVGQWLREHADVPVGNQEPIPGTTIPIAS